MSGLFPSQPVPSGTGGAQAANQLCNVCFSASVSCGWPGGGIEMVSTGTMTCAIRCQR